MATVIYLGLMVFTIFLEQDVLCRMRDGPCGRIILVSCYLFLLAAISMLQLSAILFDLRREVRTMVSFNILLVVRSVDRTLF